MLVDLESGLCTHKSCLVLSLQCSFQHHCMVCGPSSVSSEPNAWNMAKQGWLMNNWLLRKPGYTLRLQSLCSHANQRWENFPGKIPPMHSYLLWRGTIKRALSHKQMECMHTHTYKPAASESPQENPTHVHSYLTMEIYGVNYLNLGLLQFFPPILICRWVCSRLAFSQKDFKKTTTSI